MSDNSFKVYVSEQLSQISELKIRPMFSGFGLYQKEIFFGIISKGTLYFKTNEKTRPEYIKLGSGPFRPSEKQTLKNYYEVPGDILENKEQLTSWARDAARIK